MTRSGADFRFLARDAGDGLSAFLGESSLESRCGWRDDSALVG